MERKTNKMKNNKELEKVFNEDQKDRKNWKNTQDYLKKVRKRDKNRRKIVEKILKNKKSKTGVDFYHASMVFQHGENTKDFKKAQSLAKKSIELNYKKAKWLYAATTDRLLMFQGKKQKFGTQFQLINTPSKIKKDPPKQRWILYTVDKRTSDTTREKYNVIPLGESLKRVQEMNRVLQ